MITIQIQDFQFQVVPLIGHDANGNQVEGRQLQITDNQSGVRIALPFDAGACDKVSADFKISKIVQAPASALGSLPPR